MGRDQSEQTQQGTGPLEARRSGEHPRGCGGSAACQHLILASAFAPLRGCASVSGSHLVYSSHRELTQWPNLVDTPCQPQSRGHMH